MTAAALAAIFLRDNRTLLKASMYKMNSNRLALAGLCALSIVLVVPSTAFAYLDPGTGSIILQTLLAAVIGALFTLKLYWRRIRTWLSGLLNKTQAS